jgi:murein L,D-transpeptidase YafK
MHRARKLLFPIALILITITWCVASHAQGIADKVLVLKSKRELILLTGGTKIKTYHISLGKQPVGPKTHRGDGRTPEGLYTIDKRNARSGYHLALHISYPNSRDVMNARRSGRDPGGDVMIHGLPNGNKSWIYRRWPDWTAGCIAVSNKEIEEIWRSVPAGTPIEIRP